MIPPASLAGYSDEELTEMYAGADQGEALDGWRGMIEAEWTRRAGEDTAARVVAGTVRAYGTAPKPVVTDEVRAEWERAAHAQFLDAERECSGYLVRGPSHDYAEDPAAPGKCSYRLHAGSVACGHLSSYPKHTGVDAFVLWSGPDDWARQHATDELRAFWDAHPRMTVTEYRRQAAGERKQWQEAKAMTKAVCKHPGRTGAAICGDCPRRIAGGTAASVAAGTIRGYGTDPARAARLAALRGRAEAIQAGRGSQSHAEPVSGPVMPSQTAGPYSGGAGQMAAPGTAVALRPAATVAQPGQEPVDGAEILGYVRLFIDQYARMPSEAAADVVALWIAHAHCRSAGGSLVFESTPRLMLLSREPGSGKSRVLNLARMACGGRFGLLTEPTAWAIAHIVGPAHEGAFIDEGDVLFGKGSRKESVRAVLNSGYTRDGVIAHMRGKSTEALEVFGPVAVAGLDVMRTATGVSLEPLFTRSITVRMRKSPDPVPPVGRDARGKAAMLHVALGIWAGQNRDQLGDEPGLPGWLANRDGEVWGPLVAVASAAEASHLAQCPGEECEYEHGQWQERALTAAAELCGAWEQPQDEGDDIMAGLAGMFAAPVGWGEGE